MSYLILGSHPVSSAGSTIPTLGHLFLAFSNDATLGNDDSIIRAGPLDSTFLGITFGQLAAEINIPFRASKDSFINWGDTVDLTEDEASTLYASIVIDLTFQDFGTLDAGAAWQSLVSTAAQIHNYDFAYNLFNQNSNSFVGTLLATLGIEAPGLNSLVTSLGSLYLYPASGTMLTYDPYVLFNANRLYDILGAYQLDEIGVEIPFNDRLFALNSDLGIPLQNVEGDHLSGLGGNDELHDGNRMDTLEGGAGDDTFILSNDGARDIIIVGEGDDIILALCRDRRLVRGIIMRQLFRRKWRPQV